jgi:UDP-glucose 4-epimerase
MGAVAITGAGGYIGRQIIRNLEKRDWCNRILGTDIIDPKVRPDKLTFLKKDIRDHSLIDYWKDQHLDAMVHLAFIFNPIHDEKRMYDINVNGTLNILRICEELKIGHVIVASSGTAYGAWPDNPEPLKESDPIRGFPSTFAYSYHKGLNEGHFTDFMARNPEVLFNIVRPCVVFGPNTDNYLSRYFRNLPFGLLADGNDANFQFVHEDDLAEFFSLLIEKKVPGTFNVAGDGVIRGSETFAMIGKRSFKVPRWLNYSLLSILWKLRVKRVEAPAGILNYISYPWVLDTSRAKEMLGWKPKYTTKETLQIMFETHGYKLVQ